MARKTNLVTITEEGRDKGRHYLVTEMPPRQSEKWASRVLFAIAKSGGDNREAEEVAKSGMAGLAAVGLRSLTRMDFSDAEPLMDEMLSCVQFVGDPNRVDQATGKAYARPLAEDDIEEVATLLALRSEVIQLHTGFSPADFLSKWGAAMKAKLSGANIETSPPPSA